jgi:hypothetical protein
MFGSSPRLFAAYRALRRLLAPRHPPYALHNLALMLALAMEFPKSTANRRDDLRSGSILLSHFATPRKEGSQCATHFGAKKFRLPELSGRRLAESVLDARLSGASTPS